MACAVTSALPDVSITGLNLGDLANFQAVKFDNVLQALKAISAFLSQFAAFDFLDDVSERGVVGRADHHLHAAGDHLLHERASHRVAEASAKFVECLRSSAFVEIRVAAVWTMRDGTAFQLRIFGDKEQALETLQMYLETKSVTVNTGSRPINPFGL